MEFQAFIRAYRKGKKLSVRKFAEMLDVSQFRLEKWETGIHPNYEDSIKIKRYFGVKDIQNFSEESIKSFEPKETAVNEVIKLKDIIIEEKEKRIQSLEETIQVLKEANAIYQRKNKG